MTLEEIEGAAVSFVYSFYLDSAAHDFDEIQRDLTATGLKCCKERPEESNGIDPEYRTRLLRSCFLDFGEAEVGVEGCIWSLRRYARLFDSGIATVTVQMRNRSTPLKLSDVREVLGLVGELENEGPVGFRATILGEEKDTSLYGLFLESVHSILSAVGVQHEGRGGDLQEINWDKIQYCNVTQRLRSSVRWLDWEIADMESSEFQQPFVVTQIRLPASTFQKIFIERENDARENVKAEILSLLLREIEHRNVRDMDLTFAKEFMRIAEDGIPVNMNLNAHLFMHFHPRSCLVIRSGGERDPGRFLVPSLLDVIDLVRTRWHMSVVINALLDTLLRSVRLEAKASMQDLAELIDQRLRLGSLLEDPITYRWAGGSLKVVYEEAIRQLKVVALEEAGLKKMNLAHTLFSDRLLREEMVRFEALKDVRRSR